MNKNLLFLKSLWKYQGHETIMFHAPEGGVRHLAA